MIDSERFKLLYGTEDEISWLGVDTDRAIAKVLGRSVEAVTLKPQHRGIPAYRGERG